MLTKQQKMIMVITTLHIASITKKENVNVIKRLPFFLLKCNITDVIKSLLPKGTNKNNKAIYGKTSYELYVLPRELLK